MLAEAGEAARASARLRQDLTAARQVWTLLLPLWFCLFGSSHAVMSTGPDGRTPGAQHTKYHADALVLLSALFCTCSALELVPDVGADIAETTQASIPPPYALLIEISPGLLLSGGAKPCGVPAVAAGRGAAPPRRPYAPGAPPWSATSILQHPFISVAAFGAFADHHPRLDACFVLMGVSVGSHLHADAVRAGGGGGGGGRRLPPAVARLPGLRAGPRPAPGSQSPDARPDRNCRETLAAKALVPIFERNCYAA